jgi:muramoyltetrapeptide carboxypeptidase
VIRRPRALQSGDRIAVVAPASWLARDEFERGVAEIARLGFEPVYDDSVFAREAGYLAGPAAVRAETFLRYWSDPGVAALVAARGGYGSVQLLPLIGEALRSGLPKLFVGFSDNTSILSWLTCQGGTTALHGPMLDHRLARGGEGYDESSFLAFLQDGAGMAIAPDGMTVVAHGEHRGPVFGGTLTQLAGSLGTPYAFDPPDGCVLFIEDVNERPYRLDRLLTHLRLGGVLARAGALVFGEMKGCDEPGGAVLAHDVIAAFARDFPGPVISGLPSGHTTGPTWTLPLGVRAAVVTRPRPAVIVEESPVA